MTRQGRTRLEKTGQVNTPPKSTLLYVFVVYGLQYTSVARDKSQEFKGRRLAKGTISEKIRQDKKRQGITRQEKTRLNKTGLDKTTTRQDKTSQNKTRQDKTR